MEGYTEVSHKDLESTIFNWRRLYDRTMNVHRLAEVYQRRVWRLYPWYVKLWLHIKSGIFTPEEKFLYGSLYRKKYFSGFEWKYRRYLFTGYRTYSHDIARSVERHLYKGKHYFTGEQVKFINIFKEKPND